MEMRASRRKNCMLLKYNNKKNLIILIICFLVIGLFSYFLFTDAFNRSEPVARGGVAALDDFGENVQVLTGEWEFYPNQLITGSSLARAKGSGVITDIPGVWNNIQVDGKPLSGFGYGTYHLTVTGLRDGQRAALYIPLLSVSFDVYAGDELIASNGKVSADEAGFRPSFLPQTASFKAQGDTAEIFVQTSNYIYARNGMWHAIYIGTPGQIEWMGRMVIYKDLFMIGSFLTLAIYYLALYILRRDRQNLLFILLCVGSILRMFANGDRAVLRLFPSFPFDLVVKFDYLAILLFYPIFLFLLVRRFPKEFSPGFSRILLGVSAVLALLVLVLPVSLFTNYVIVAEALLFVTLLYTQGSLGAALWRGRNHAPQMFFSFLLLVVLTIHDALYQSSVIESPLGEISAFGFFILLMIESFAISRDYADNYKAVRELSEQLLESDKLKDRVRQTEMAFLQSQIKPHFLYNTLSVIDEYCFIDPAQASRLLNSFAKYLRQSFAFENLESMVSIETELQLVQNYVDVEKARFDYLRFESQIEYDGTFSLPPLTIQPLVENAIRHGVSKKEGSGSVRLHIWSEGDAVRVEISDDGAGMANEKLGLLLNGAGHSVGLLNIHSRLLHMFGSGLEIWSETGTGTRVSFRIPLGGEQVCGQ